MRLISKKTILNFTAQYPDVEQAMLTWLKEVNTANCNSPLDIKLKYPSASILNNNRVAFNLKGNNYRLIVRINYGAKIVWIRFIGTHSQYDKIDANNI
jgi:mRNA interferase HigB